MKEGWEIKKLGEVATYINGYAFKPDDWKETGVPIIRIQNLNNKIAPFNYCDIDVPSKYVVNTGDILISWSASLGVYEWKLGKAFLNQHIFKVVFDKCDIDKYYLKYVVGAKLNDMAKNAHGATMKHIVKKDFDNTTIPVPSLSVQERIVSELDLLSGLIEKKKEQLKGLDNLAQAIFFEMFGDPINNEKGWETKKLGEVGKCITGSTPSTKNKDFYSSNDYCFVKPSDIAKEGVSYISSAEFYVSQSAYEQSRQLPKDSVLVTCIGIVGKVGVTKKDCMCNQQINAIIPNADINSIYLAYSVLSERKILENMANAPVVPIINKTSFSLLAIPLPPLPLQESFASKISAIEEQKSKISASLAETETLFQSRMSYYFD